MHGTAKRTSRLSCSTIRPLTFTGPRGLRATHANDRAQPVAFRRALYVAASGRREDRHRHAAFGFLECDFDFLPDFDRVEIAIDDVRQHRHALVELDVGDAIHDGAGAAAHAVAVNLAGAFRLDPLHLVAEAERAQRAREVMVLAAIAALLQHEFARR